MKPNWKTLFILTTCCTLGLMTSVKAQVSPDGTLSTTVASPDNLNFTINNGNRVGGNLFHSFREFSVPNGGSAVFQNPLDVQNIINRVTGGSLSQINGLIQSQGSANLFLLNPAGIFFGPNARLNIGGSFFATTADSLLFDNGFEFSATNPQAPPLLTVNIPIGLRFRDNPGNITNQSVVQDITGFGIGLQVNTGNSLALVGGNVSLEQGGRLTAAGGRIELGGLAGAGTVGLQTTGNTFRLNFPANGLSNVSLLDDARVAVRSNGGGDIAVNANIFTATNGGRLVGGIEDIATRNGGDITVNSNQFNISGAGIYQQVIGDASGNVGGNIFVNTKSFNASSGGQLQNTVLFGGTGNAGNIFITSNSLSLTGGSEINTSTFGQGNAGNVTLRVENGDISFAGESFIFSTVEPGQDNAGNPVITQRNAGKIDIITRNLTLTDSSQLQTLVRSEQQGNAGNITVQASGTVRIAGRNSPQGNPSSIFSNVQSGANGNAGNIFINAGSIFTDDALLTTSNAGTGSSGSITLNAPGEVSIANNSNFFSNVTQNGRAGNINIKAGSLSLLGGSELQSGVLEGGQGNGGNVTIDVPTGTVRIIGRDSDGNRSGIFNDVESGASGNGGNIIINAGSIFTDDAELNTRNRGNGSAGDISLQAGDAIALTNNSVINSSIFGRGNAGNVTLRAENGDISLAGGSLIFSTVESGGVGNAGKIDIITRNLSLTDGSQLQTLVRGGQQGNAGNITVQASGTVRIAGRQPGGNPSGIFSEVQSGASGNAGNISINAGSIFTDDAELNTRNRGNGSAGDISLQAGDAIALTNGTEISSSISGRGNAGDVTLRAENGDISLAGGSDIFSTVESGGMGNAGKIDIITRNFSLTNSQVQTSLRAGQGNNAGNITVQASGTVRIAGRTSQGNPSGIFSEVQSGANGDGGNITIKAGSIFTDDALLRARNTGTGSAGDITLNARDQISLNQSMIESTGRFGRIFIGQSSTKNAPPVVPNNINIDNSTLNTTNSSTDIAGDIVLNARDQISLDRRSIIQSDGNRGRIFIGKNDTYGDGISSPRVVSLNNNSPLRTSNASVTGALNTPINSGDISVDALDSIFLGNGSEITAFSFRLGNAGNVTIRSGNSVTLSGVAPAIREDGTAGGFSSGLFSSSEDANSGAGGQILVETPNLRILDGAVISARSLSGANAGNIRVNSQNVELRGGGQILATAFNGGNAGNIDVTANRITISGTDPTLNTRFNQVAQQFGESVARQRIDPVFDESGMLVNNSGIFVNSTGTGQGGNLSITGNTLTLDRGTINASTTSGNGGNINLRLRNFIRLRNESLISASAGGNGNGGNITINSPFIVAFPRNNDITANAGRGSGGQVIINATLFGIAPLSAEDLRRLRPNDSNPRQLSTSDITAISRDNPSLSLPVQVNSPDVDPSRGLVELPEAVTDPTQKVAENPCKQGIGNEFFVTGRGGLPTTPNQTLNSDNVRVDLLQPVASSGNSRNATIKPATTVTATRVPAQGWIFNDKGQVVLTAYDPTNTGSQRPFSTAAACPAR